MSLELGTYYKADGEALPNLPISGDWPAFHAAMGLSLTPPKADLEPEPEPENDHPPKGKSSAAPGVVKQRLSK